LELVVLNRKIKDAIMAAVDIIRTLQKVSSGSISQRNFPDIKEFDEHF